MPADPAPSRYRPTWTLTAASGLGLVLVLPLGCSATTDRTQAAAASPAAEEVAADAPLPTLGPGGTILEDWIANADEAWGNLENPPADQPPARARPLGSRPQAVEQPPNDPNFPPAGLAALVAEGQQAASPAESDDAASPGAAEPDPATHPAALARALARDAAERAATSANPIREAVLLAAIEASVDGSGRWLSDAAMANLTPEERGALDRLRGILDEIGRGDDPVAAIDRLNKGAADEGAETDGFRIDRAALCTRVEGFGRYTPYANNTFTAGRPIRAVVYAEVSGYQATPATVAGGAAGWQVELSQELLLYHDADGTLAWRQSPRRSTYTSRTRPDDYFVVNQITLPRNLTIGSYHLKVVMRDANGVATDESILPIQVVADRAVVVND